MLALCVALPVFAHAQTSDEVETKPKSSQTGKKAKSLFKSFGDRVLDKAADRATQKVESKVDEKIAVGSNSNRYQRRKDEGLITEIKNDIKDESRTLVKSTAREGVKVTAETAIDKARKKPAKAEETDEEESE